MEQSSTDTFTDITGNNPDAANQPNVVKYVGFWKRLLCYCIDIMIPSLILVAAAALQVLLERNGLPNDVGSSGNSLNIISKIVFSILGIISIIYFPAFWYFKGATPAKMLLGVKIISVNQTPLTLWQVIVRYIIWAIFAVGIGLGAIWIAFDKRKQGWHDKVAGTLVVKTKS